MFFDIIQIAEVETYQRLTAVKWNSLVRHNAKQWRTGGVQGNPVIKVELFCNHYRISPVTEKNSNNCRIIVLWSQDFSARPLFYPVWCCTVLKKFISLQFIFGICQLLRSGLFHKSKWLQSSSRITITKQSNSNNQKLNLISFILFVHLDIIFWQWNIRQRKTSKYTGATPDFHVFW